MESFTSTKTSLLEEATRTNHTSRNRGSDDDTGASTESEVDSLANDGGMPDSSAHRLSLQHGRQTGCVAAITNNPLLPFNPLIQNTSNATKHARDISLHSPSSHMKQNQSIVSRPSTTQNEKTIPQTPENGKSSSVVHDQERQIKNEPVPTHPSNDDTVSTDKLPKKKSSVYTPNYSKSGNGKLTYVSMIHQAIVALADHRSGSSVPAIIKYMMGQHLHLQELPFAKMKQSISMALKSALKEERFIKVKASFKVNSAWVKKEQQALRAKEFEKKAREKKRKQEMEQARARKQKEDEERKEMARLERLKEEAEAEKRRKEAEMTPEELEAIAKKEAAKEEAERGKAEAAARAKEVAERIRKRKFPMDDLQLIAEDKELGVKPPIDVCKRPILPYAMMTAIPFDQRPSGRPSSAVVSASSSNVSNFGNRGLVSDVLQVYHFFRGDVGLSRVDENVSPPFSLNHLMFSVNEILIGNAKIARVVPPLISHLFVTALRILTNPIVYTATPAGSEGAVHSLETRLQSDLIKLSTGLCSTSWAEITFYYFDLMERFYTADESIEPNVLPGAPITMNFFSDREEEEKKIAAANTDIESNLVIDESETVIPDGYCRYLGHPNGAIYKGFAKLSRNDPWNLSAEELLALLRVLTDDILASNFQLAENISNREQALYELSKANKAAEYQYRKVRVAYEGPKNLSKAKKLTDQTATDDKRENGHNGEENADEMQPRDEESKLSFLEEDSKKEFKPTATKEEFEAAERARNKAADAYKKGLKKLIGRTKPIGSDRYFNRIYFFHHDPDKLYVESCKSPSTTSTQIEDLLLPNHSKTWHIIDTKTTFDEFVSSLDIRGTREDLLHEALTGCSSLKRFLFDDNRKNTLLMTRKRDVEEFERRLTNAKIACAKEEEAGGRRSGRLASFAQIELSKIEDEINVAAEIFKAETADESPNYHVLAGLEMLQEFDFERQKNSKKSDSHCALHFNEAFSCSKLWHDDDYSDCGAVGLIVSEMLQLENLCNELADWENFPRKAWKSSLLDTASAWTRGSILQLGPTNSTDEKSEPVDCNKELDNCSIEGTDDIGRSQKRENAENGNSDKRRKTHNLDTKSFGIGSSSPSVSQILAVLKEPLIELEARIFYLTGLEMSIQAADEASDNISVTSLDANEEREKSLKSRAQYAWKEKVNSLHPISVKRAGAIRDVLIDAIAISRKGHLFDVLKALRSALQQHRPGAAGAAKSAALEALEKFGGFVQVDGDDDDNESGTDGDAVDTEECADKKLTTHEKSSLLCAEAMMLTGSLDGDKNADRFDWSEAVKGCKTISRFSALTQAFSNKARVFLQKLKKGKSNLLKAIGCWEENEKRQRKGKMKSSRFVIDKKNGNYDSSTEIWTDTKLTDEFVMGKVVGHPWWPARICEAKDQKITHSLKSMNRVLITFIGEQHLHVVIDKEEVRPYTDAMINEEDTSVYDDDTVKKLKESMTMTRRILRRRDLLQNKIAIPAFSNNKPLY